MLCALKKMHASEQERPDVAAAREQWRQDQPGLDPARLVFIDETGTSTNMVRSRGPREPRPAASSPLRGPNRYSPAHYTDNSRCSAGRQPEITTRFRRSGKMNSEAGAEADRTSIGALVARIAERLGDP